MLKLSRKQACAVALSAVFSFAVFSAPVFSAMELPVASSAAETEDPFQGGIYSEPAAPSQPDAGGTVSVPPVSTPDVSTPGVVSGEPGGDVSGGIEPLPDDSSSAAASETVSEPADSGAEASSAPAASSEPAAPSSWPTVEPSYPSYENPPVTTPNTDQALIDQLASQAAQANSDPEVLTSQDWSELLSQAGAEESGAESRASSDGAIVSPEDGEDGGSTGGMTASNESSWLLPTGIVLILLAIAGIAAFVFLQFILPRRQARASAPLSGAQIDPSVDDSFGGSAGTDETQDGYVDVSSGSHPHSYTGSPYDDDPYAEYARAKEEAEARQSETAPDQQALASQETMEISSYELQQQQQAPASEMEDLFSSDETEQLVRSGGTRQTQLPTHQPDAPAAPQAEPAPQTEPVSQPEPAPQAKPQQAPASQQARSKAQATPVAQDDSKPFDWDKFFDE